MQIGKLKVDFNVESSMMIFLAKLLLPEWLLAKSAKIKGCWIFEVSEKVPIKLDY
jgi:hypothetical protein